MVFHYYKLLRLFYPKFHWEIKTTEKVIYLTFDDGPFPEVTTWVLDLLKQYNAKATFFCIGDNIRKHPELLERIKSEGHSTGNHTFTHPNGWKQSKNEYLDNFLKCEEYNKTSLFRPPYGRIKRNQAREILKSHSIILWTVLTKDYQTRISPERCLKRALSGVKPGAIVLFHDSRKAEKNLRYTLPRFMEVFIKKGYKFKAISPGQIAELVDFTN